MLDTFQDHARSLTSPAADAATIVPADGIDLQHVSRAIYVGVGGDLTVQMASGAVVTLAAVPAGALYPLRAARVLATGTTASGIVAFW